MNIAEVRLDAEQKAPTPQSGLISGLLRTARPRQWVKNVLVAAAPVAAAKGDWATLRATAIIFLAFCLAASAIYFLNDAADVHADRMHPDKRHRPIASGAVPVTLGWVMCTACAAAALAVAVSTTWQGLAVVAVYLTLNVAYSLRLKHVVIVDLAIVSSGFLLRAMAGGLAAGLPLSQWFLLVTGFGALFVVAGKRYSELVLMEDKAALSRKSLAGYSLSYLRFVWGVAAAIAVMSYCLWAFEVSQAGSPHVPWSLLSIVPFTFSILGYAYFIDAGRAGKPEEVVLGSSTMPLLGFVWTVMFGLGALHV